MPIHNWASRDPPPPTPHSKTQENARMFLICSLRYLFAGRRCAPTCPTNSMSLLRSKKGDAGRGRRALHAGRAGWVENQKVLRCQMGSTRVIQKKHLRQTPRISCTASPRISCTASCVQPTEIPLSAEASGHYSCRCLLPANPPNLENRSTNLLRGVVLWQKWTCGRSRVPKHSATFRKIIVATSDFDDSAQ